jgi:hypothetical protein
MQNVAVYQYQGFSLSEGRTIRPETFATMEYITRIQALSPILESKMEVSISLVDGEGRYIGPYE